MKVSGLYNLVVPTLFSFTTFGQKANPTRNETEAWLLEKMNKYVAKNTITCHELFPGDNSSFNKKTDCSTYTNVNFSFSNDDLIITANIKKTEYNDNGNVENNFTRKLLFHCMI